MTMTMMVHTNNSVPTSPTIIKDTLGEEDTSSMSSTSTSSSSIENPRLPPQQQQQRRSIFHRYWEKSASSSSLMKDDDEQQDGNSKKRYSQSKMGCNPSYMGRYAFTAPHHLSPLVSPKPDLCPMSDGSSIPYSLPNLSSSPTSAGTYPRSILRRHKSLQKVTCCPSSADSNKSMCRPRSVSCIGPETNTQTQFSIAPPPIFSDDTASQVSKEVSSTRSSLSRDHDENMKRHPSYVHFDPTITIRECVVDDDDNDRKCNNDGQESNWFTVDDLRTFMNEAITVCHSSAVNALDNYSLPAVKEACDTAERAGVLNPVLSAYPEYRALFSDPALQTTEEDIVVNFGSKQFFKILEREMQRVLIVDNCSSSLKLFRRHILCMFPHVHIDCVYTGEQALEKVDDRSSLVQYDLIIVEEHLGDSLESLDLTGSELLRLLSINECTKNKMTSSNRTSLKIGVSVSLGDDCDSLRKGGADMFWSKPPPKPSNSLRNHVMNSLLSKRDKSIFICGC